MEISIEHISLDNCERELFELIFNQLLHLEGSEDSEALDKKTVANFMKKCNLPVSTLQCVWRSSVAGLTQVSREAFCRILKLIKAFQVSLAFFIESLGRPLGAPDFEGQDTFTISGVSVAELQEISNFLAGFPQLPKDCVFRKEWETLCENLDRFARDRIWKVIVQNEHRAMNRAEVFASVSLMLQFQKSGRIPYFLDHKWKSFIKRQAGSYSLTFEFVRPSKEDFDSADPLNEAFTFVAPNGGARSFDRTESSHSALLQDLVSNLSEQESRLGEFSRSVNLSQTEFSTTELFKNETFASMLSLSKLVELESQKLNEVANLMKFVVDVSKQSNRRRKERTVRRLQSTQLLEKIEQKLSSRNACQKNPEAQLPKSDLPRPEFFKVSTKNQSSGHCKASQQESKTDARRESQDESQIRSNQKHFSFAERPPVITLNAGAPLSRKCSIDLELIRNENGWEEEGCFQNLIAPMMIDEPTLTNRCTVFSMSSVHDITETIGEKLSCLRPRRVTVEGFSEMKIAPTELDPNDVDRSLLCLQDIHDLNSVEYDNPNDIGPSLDKCVLPGIRPDPEPLCPEKDIFSKVAALSPKPAATDRCDVCPQETRDGPRTSLSSSDSDQDSLLLPLRHDILIDDPSFAKKTNCIEGEDEKEGIESRLSLCHNDSPSSDSHRLPKSATFPGTKTPGVIPHSSPPLLTTLDRRSEPEYPAIAARTNKKN